MISCSNCEFWFRLSASDNVGECRRYPPTQHETFLQITEVGYRRLGTFFVTKGNYCCGEGKLSEPFGTSEL